LLLLLHRYHPLAMHLHQPLLLLLLEPADPHYPLKSHLPSQPAAAAAAHCVGLRQQPLAAAAVQQQGC
jgi:hypothetical protein